jgi:RNA polymerase sigma factor (sigma-70 family)
MQDHQYDSLSSYINLAKKTISKFGPKIYNGLSKEMLKNEDAIADVAYAIMIADWKYDENRIGKSTGKKKTRYSYRNQCAIWAIQTYATKSKKKRNILSIDNNIQSDDGNTYESLLADSIDYQPVNSIIDREKTELSNSLVKMIFDSNILTDKQKSQLQMYYFDDMTLQQIGDHFGVTREAVRQTIKNSVKKLQEVLV